MSRGALQPDDRRPPKIEERASDKLCDAIRSYFADRAVTVDREVQLRRRLVPKRAGGQSGSEADLIVRVQPLGSTVPDAIVIPIEVKLSSNPEATTGLREQLVERYMKEVCADAGVFVVMWMQAPDMTNVPTPKWTSIQAAEKDLNSQAVSVASRSDVRVRAVVVDCSLQ